MHLRHYWMKPDYSFKEDKLTSKAAERAEAAEASVPDCNPAQ